MLLLCIHLLSQCSMYLVFIFIDLVFYRTISKSGVKLTTEAKRDERVLHFGFCTRRKSITWLPDFGQLVDLPHQWGFFFLNFFLKSIKLVQRLKGATEFWNAFTFFNHILRILCLLYTQNSRNLSFDHILSKMPLEWNIFHHKKYL